MKKNSLLLFIIVLVATTPNLFAQNAQPEKASTFGILQGPVYVPSIAQQIKDGTFQGVDPNEEAKLGHPKRRGINKNVPGKGFPKGDDPLIKNQKSATKLRGREPLLVFNANTANATPSDPTGAVGPNHFIGAWNSGFRIFDKDGNPLTNEASLSTLFPGNNMGDPIVFYDAEADRFVITEFDSSPNGFNVAVCQGPDPVNDGWYIYTSGFGTGSFPDYTKFSVWSDGYYVTANIGATNKVFAIEREEMLLGNAAQFVGFPLPGLVRDGFYSPQFFTVTNDDLPAVGNATVVYLQDDAWSGISEDHLKLWTVNVDWTDIANSTISAPVEIVTSPFIGVFDGGSFSNVKQPGGPDQDVLQATIMNQAQFRKFPTYNSAIFNFVVDTDGSGGELAGIRWYELRQDNDGDPWTIYQEGTYISPYDEKHAFSGSMVMDGQGNIGMGYTTCNLTNKIAIQYTGRFANDPLGQMTIDESLIAQSTTNNPSNRLADYVQISLDPANDKTFWHIAEFFNSGQRTDVVGVFQIASDFLSDVGIVSIDEPTNGTLSDTETVTVTISNFGENEQTDIPVTFQVDGGVIISEVLTGPLASGATVQYTFTTTADLGTTGQTYQIKSFTNLDTDEDRTNDTITKSIISIFLNDIGVTAITSPTSGVSLTEEELITVTVTNYGTADQTNFDLTYSIDDITVTEQVEGPLVTDSPISYTFEQTGNFSVPRTYSLSAYTILPNDDDNNNDTTSISVMNTLCQPESNCSNGAGFYLFKLRTIDNITECSETGYSDYTELTTDLETNETYELTINTHYGDQFFKLWIDFNDNFVFEEDELLIDNYEIGDGQAYGDYTETIIIEIPENANLGEHIMRAKSNLGYPIPDNACDETAYGETEDYMANIILYTGMDNIPLSNTEMVVKSFANNQFEISLQSSEISEDLIINLHNIMGQKLVENRVKNINGRYVYQLDLSYAKPGAYIVRLGNSQYGKVQRLIVK